MSLRIAVARLLRLWTPLAVSLAAACGGDPGGDPVEPPVSPQILTVALTPTTIQLAGAAQTATLTAVVTSSAGTVASPAITWTSSDVAVATVAGNGAAAVVTSVAAGSASIRATFGGVVGSADVTVLPPSSISLIVAPASGTAGGIATTGVTIQRNNFTLPVTLELLGAPNGVTGTFGTGGRPAAGAGEVQALVLTIVASVAPGTYPMSVRASGSGISSVTQPFVLTVLAPPVASIEVTPNAAQLLVGATLQLAAVTRTSDGAVVTGRPIVWTSSVPSRASVASSGVVTGISAGDSVTITATSEGISAVARILVYAVTPGIQSVVELGACADPNGWFAMQDGPSAPWTRVTRQGTRVTISSSNSRIGLAYASSGWTSIVYLDRSELASLPPEYLCNLQRVANNAREIGIRFASNTPLDAIISGRIGDASPLFFPSIVTQLGAAQVSAPRTGRRDLAWVLSAKPDSLRALIRRDVDMSAFPDGAVVQAPLDFFGPESGAILNAPLTLSDFPPVGSLYGSLGYEPFAVVGASCNALALPREDGTLRLIVLVLDEISASPIPDHFATRSDVLTDLGTLPVTRGTIDGAFKSTGFAGSLLRPGEVIGGIASYFNLTSLTEGEARVVSETYSGLAVRTLQAPSAMPAVYPSIVNGAGYRRFRTQLTLPADLDDAFVVRYRGAGARTLSMRASAAYLQGRTVDLTVPDFTNVAGWDNAWGPSGQTQFEIRGEKSTRTTACSAGRTAISMRLGTA